MGLEDGAGILWMRGYMKIHNGKSLNIVIKEGFILMFNCACEVWLIVVVFFNF